MNVRPCYNRSMFPLLAGFGVSAFQLFSLSPLAFAQEKVTYQDHILPLVEANCAKCHNADKKKGDLDLTSYSSAIAGGASGKVLVAGDPDSSKLWKVINHLEDPNMPPNRGKLADKELATIRKWIAGGLLESFGSKAIAANKPSVDLSIGATSIGKPEGPPPMPGELLLDPVVAVKRPAAVTGLASSPWAPVFAVAGQKQVVLYHADSMNLLGILPFTDGAEYYQPTDVKFSRNGKLIVVAGGHAAKAGRVAVFDITTGERVIMVGSGQEFDSVLSADISPDQSRIAAGGPSKMVRVYSTKDGSVLFKMKKHTDWVTAVAFSPSGEYLATADRNGGISVWDADNGVEVHTLAGHKAAVTALSWRGDSKVLASVSEDGAAKICEMSEGKQVKTWNPHPGGALSLAYTHDGRMVTCGRDNHVDAWTADGGKLRAFNFTNDLPVRATFSHDGKRVFAADWTGSITAWNVDAEKPVAELAANPPALSEQLAAAEARLKQLQTGNTGSAPAPVVPAALAKAQADLAAASNAVAKAQATLAPKQAETDRLKAEIAKKSTPDLVARLATARETRNASRLALTNAVAALNAKAAEVARLKQATPATKAADPAAELAELRNRIARLKAGQVYAGVYHTRESIALKKRDQEKLLASGTKADKSAADKLAAEIARQEKELQKMTALFEKLKAEAPVQQSKL